MNDSLLICFQSLLGIAVLFATACLISMPRVRSGGWNAGPTGPCPPAPPAPPKCYSGNRCGAVAILIAVIAATACSGCCVPCQPVICHCPDRMAPRFREPPRVYGEPMHPILREDGATVLMPHTRFQNWIQDDPEGNPEAGKSFGP